MKLQKYFDHQNFENSRKKAVFCDQDSQVSLFPTNLNFEVTLKSYFESKSNQTYFYIYFTFCAKLSYFTFSFYFYVNKELLCPTLLEIALRTCEI